MTVPGGVDFAATFAGLKPVLAKYAKRMAVKADTPVEYTLLTKSASPFPQHKGEPLENELCSFCGIVLTRQDE